MADDGSTTSEAALQERVRELEAQLVHAREVEARLSTLLGQAGNSVDEPRGIQEQMQQTQKLESLGVLAGGIAHDFNNILLSVMGNAELLLLDVPPDSPMRAYLKEILASSQRAAGLCMQMLAYSGKGPFIVRPVDISVVVREMTHLLDVSVSKRAQLRSMLSDGLPPIRADAAQLGQIVVNLVTNASEAFSNGDGTILLSTGLQEYGAEFLAASQVGDPLPPGDYVYLEIADSGDGIDPETRSRMFDPFFSSKALGRGLGLSAVLGIIRGHGGGIHVDTAPGQGTTITVLFPVSEEAIELPSETAEPPDLEKGAGAVMVVDDEAPVRLLAERALERAGYLVFTACDGAEAVEFFREYHGRVDLVLLDITMPKMGGREALERIREINPEVRVIMMSGYDKQSVVRSLKRTPKLDFLQKPYKPTLLIERVNRMLKRR